MLNNCNENDGMTAYLDDNQPKKVGNIYIYANDVAFKRTLD